MRNKGFTIIELLVIISVIGLISSIALGNLSQARERARTAAGLQFDSSVRRAQGDTLTGAWNFNEGAGDTAFDSSGNGRDGSVAGATYVSPGINGTGYALFFNGSENFVSGLANQAGDNQNLTLSAWINPTQNINSQDIFSSGYVACTNYAVSLTSARISVRNRFGSKYTTGTPESTGQANIPNNTWTHVATTFDDTGQATTYINGQVSGSATDIPTTDCASDVWVIGGASIVSDPGDPSGISIGEAFYGMIDEVAVYDSSLTASEVQKIYAQSAPRFLVKN